MIELSSLHLYLLCSLIGYSLKSGNKSSEDLVSLA